MVTDPGAWGAGVGRTRSTPAIHTRGLSKRYRSVTALTNVTMTVERGEVFGFLGPNGAGKTTVVKLLLGLSQPTAGEGWVLGAPLGDLVTRQKIGYLPELFRYQEWLSAREVLALHCALARLPRRDWDDEIARALDTVGLSTRAHHRVGTFSKGMQQRLGLGVALLGHPELVLLDEPTSALDPVGRHEVREIIQQLKRRGTTVFLNSHLLTEIEQVCDRVAVIDHGQLIALSTVHELTGDTHTLRLHLEGVSDAVRVTLGRAGEVSQAEGWYTIRGIAPRAVPDLVAAIVGLGGRIHAVEPVHQTLEDRFLQLLKGGADAGADHSATDTA